MINYFWEKENFIVHFRFQNSAKGVMDEVTIFELIFIEHFLIIVTYQSNSAISDFTGRPVFAHIRC
jgi:hypothetical protein